MATEAERIAELHRLAREDLGTPAQREAREVDARDQSGMTRTAGNTAGGSNYRRRRA